MSDVNISIMLSVGNGRTFYVTLDEARELHRALENMLYPCPEITALPLKRTFSEVPAEFFAGGDTLTIHESNNDVRLFPGGNDD